MKKMANGKIDDGAEITRPEEIKKPEAEKPRYTRGEEIFSWVVHLTGAAFAVIATAVGVYFAAEGGNTYAIAGVITYGVTMLLLYLSSTLYHALRIGNAKRIFRIFDHCSIFLLIAGTYTPITLVTFMDAKPWIGWVMLGGLWAAAVVGIILNAIDLKKYEKLSMACYIIMGWAGVMTGKTLIDNMAVPGLILLLAGGILYTVGAVIYGIGKRKRYMHSIWHFFVLFATILQYFSILFYVIGT